MTWPPETEADLQSALNLGDVTESNRLDVKATVGNSDRDRKETAKDLASFAVDGGSLLIGVKEDKEKRSFLPQPVDLHDAVERIEQIAANRIDPPLTVWPREIPSKTEGLGYLWVDIPASPDAPHMVDGRYYGRGERTNRVLRDPDVLRFHQRRRDLHIVAQEALDALQEQDPFPSARPSQHVAAKPTAQFGHLYLTAIPRTASPNLAESLVWERQLEIQRFVASAAHEAPKLLNGWSVLGAGAIPIPRASALSITNFSGDAAAMETNEPYGYEIRLGTSASVSFTATGVTTGGDASGIFRLQDGTVFTSAWQVLAIVRSVATAVGYTGTWDIGLRITDLAGRHSIMIDNPSISSRGLVAYEEPRYERVIAATARDLQSPNELVKQLTRPLFRGLGIWDHWVRQVQELS